jgi:uncharacterized membrane protein YvbJ
MKCPKCGSEMEPSVCLEDVWYCTACLNEVHEEKTQGEKRTNAVLAADGKWDV